ncbi:hypothetical protein [Brevundimonas sp.]|uniref:hypothetical protein n=1 Tax=Brevundimonas sp. TaxID=1871086 RepID=UPI002D3AE60F|nr:hypothetical protein [Brevundimonas sp.]HYC99556.1 hypothetical protein [Brevundimonas sp.]
MNRREHWAGLSKIALGGVLAALLTTGCKPEQLVENDPRSGAASPAPQDDFPRDELVDHAVRIAASEVIPISPGPPIACSEFFEIISARFGDKMEQGAHAIATVNFTVRTKKAFPYTGWCFTKGGRGPGASWGPGETQVITREFQFQKWDSGWRLAG